MREEFRRRMEERRMRWHQHSGKAHIWTGVFIMLIGVAALLRATVTGLPEWLFSWQFLLIALGIFLGLRHRFKGAAWFFLILLGTAFLLRSYYPELEGRRYIWPLMLIAAGAFIIARPRRGMFSCGADEKKNAASVPNDAAMGKGDESWSDEDVINSTSVFGGTQKNILSKKFRGGEIVNIFGGTELNLSQADIEESATLEITTIFGGTKLVIPPHWNIKSEIVNILGGTDDKRPAPLLSETSGKKLLLKGTVIMGGIEIRSY